MIQSFDVAIPSVLKDRGSLLGKVTKIEIDKSDGVEYIHFDVMFRLFDGVAKPVKSKSARVPQNGTSVATGGVTSGVNIL